MTIEKFEVRNSLSGEVQFTAEIETAPDMSQRVKLSLAVKWGARNGADLRYADLRYADLRDADLRDADLRYADLRDADLSYADLSGADLSDADLRYANLSGANLRYADLRYANLSGAEWMPKIKNIHQQIFAVASKAGALDMETWHVDGYCGTTHCRAGWVVVLAGEGGRVLEGVYGTGVAAALIYQASDPALEKIPNWNASNEQALDDMKRLAEQVAS